VVLCRVVNRLLDAPAFLTALDRFGGSGRVRR
jgi:hypothetical protein